MIVSRSVAIFAFWSAIQGRVTFLELDAAAKVKKRKKPKPVKSKIAGQSWSVSRSRQSIEKKEI
jgi:hypothetical protein